MENLVCIDVDGSCDDGDDGGRQADDDNGSDSDNESDVFIAIMEMRFQWTGK